LLNCESQTIDPQFQIDKNHKMVIFFPQQNKSSKSAHFAEKERGDALALLCPINWRPQL